jgi:hypothetical protein
LGFEE